MDIIRVESAAHRRSLLPTHHLFTLTTMAIDKYVRWDEPNVEHGSGPEEDRVIHDIENQM